MNESIIPGEATKKIGSVIKALNILELFDPQHTELSLAQISKSLEMPKSTLLNFIRTLECEGYLLRNPISRNYQLGIKTMKLGYNMRSMLTIIHYAIPSMEDLCHQTNCNIYLTTHVDGSVFYLEGIYSNRRTVKYSVAGKTLPMHVTASGKAMLSYMPVEHVKEIINRNPLVAYTKHSITDPDALFREIELCHDRGYAIDNEEETLGIRCLSKAVRSPSGYPVGAISISGSTIYMTDERCESFLAPLSEACTGLAGYAAMFPMLPLASLPAIQ